MAMDAILGIVRHVLTIGAGYLVGQGMLDDSQAQTMVGAFIGLVGVAWSVWSKRK